MFPNLSQQALIQKTFGCCRWYWNQALHDNIELYKENNISKINTPAYYKKDNEWLKEVDSMALCCEQIYLQNAFRKFFNEPKVGFPKYKTKKNLRNSYSTTLSKGFDIKGNYITLPKLKQVKIKNHRKLSGNVKKATISYTPSGEYYVSVLIEENIDILPKTNSEIGVDLGLTDFAICSNGTKFPILQSYRHSLKKIAKEQRKLRNMQYGSNNYERQRKRVAKIYQHTANQRKNYLHNISTKLINENQVICLEDLSVKKMQKNHYLSISIMDAGWRIFTDMLEYKANWYGRTIQKIDKWYPSSQVCSNCGYNSGKKPLHIRKWACKKCGCIHDRDVNAAKNILKEGKRTLGMQQPLEVIYAYK